MESSKIPRLAVEKFAEVGFKVPLLDVQQYPLDSNHFIVKNRDDYPIVDYISPNRRQFYKIFHMTSGTGILTIGLHQFEMGPNEIAFLHPDEIMSWQTTSKETGGHFILVHPEYFAQDTQLAQTFRNYPFFQPQKAVIQLTEEQSSNIDRSFRRIAEEDAGQQEDKKQAILLHLQMILLESRRAGRQRTETAVPENYRYIHGFLTLLESTFQVQNPDSVVRIKTAAEFADELHVTPNYLNALVKSHTGKTVRDHIQDRLLYEAKSLLLQTDWDISSISNALGFSEHAAFTSFFNKKAQVSPSKFRRSLTAQPAR